MNNLKQIEALGALGEAWAVLLDFGSFWDNFWGAFGGTLSPQPRPLFGKAQGRDRLFAI